uniref:RecA family profile 1 domain-containing protein n=1 Tax=Leersia perrieri TaxID=77586 RepID=A0A0D9WC70_9ORYZ
MANKLVSEMRLPPHLAHLLAARRLTTAKDVLSLPEVELMGVLDSGIHTARAAVAHVSEIACPPYQTALALLEAVRLRGDGRLATTLRGLDEALRGGIPAGKLTEIVGPSGIGKTQMAGRILVLRPTSLSDFTKSEIEKSVTGLRQHPLRWSLSFLKSIAEFSQIPVVVTNQVRSQSSDDGYHYSFEVGKKDGTNSAERLESHLIAALGIQWAHAVTIRLVFEAHSGHRFIKVAKSPMSPAVAFPFTVESSGIILLTDEGICVPGPEITSIRFQGGVRPASVRRRCHKINAMQVRTGGACGDCTWSSTMVGQPALSS